jgi:CheY-like chemotaxis protein/HPt (histidine-containing phosphotransfer) domain-containing protein
MMGGEIWVESTPKMGSRFIFTATFQKSKRQVKYQPSILNDLKGLRVLAVDDCESSLQILKNYLESFSLDVTVSDNGAEALNLARLANDEGRPFGLAILDWKMPEMDGIELGKKLLELPDLRLKPKILLVSACSRYEMSQQMDYDVVHGIISKPFQKSRLFDAVAKMSGFDPTTTGKFKVGAQFNKTLISQIRGANLLLVEDNEINQQVAQELLEGFGIKVTIAENGEEAIALLKREHFDVVLMDMQMPVMDGITATREIRKIPQLSNLPIIALTANVMVSEQKEFLEAGMNDHIGKPIDPDRMVATLASWVHPAKEIAPPVSIPPAATTEDSLPDLPGVNVAESIRRIGGKIAIYYKLLDRFRVTEKNVVSRIREALASSDHKTAERIAHTLRGIAGTLGADTLQHQAALLESGIKNGEEVESLLASVDQEMGLLIANIDRAFELKTGLKSK